MKALVIGGGRVGSAVAKNLVREGWEVTVIDEDEAALARLGDWHGNFVLGHGMDIGVLERAGVGEIDAAVVATDGDNTNIVIAQLLERKYGVETIVVRLLDPARADFYRARGLHTICPTQTAVAALTDAVASVGTGPAAPAGGS